MKAKKILLPFACITSIATIITPIVTSCARDELKSFESEWSKSLEYPYPIEFKNEYESTVEQKNPAEITGSKAEAYFADIENNKQILVDDIFYNYFHEREDDKIPENSTGKTKLSVGNVSLKKESNIQTISFSAKKHCTLLAKREQSFTNDYTIEQTENVSFTCENVPVQFEFGESSHWHLSFYWEAWDEKAIKDFKISMSFKTVTIQHMKTGDDIETHEGNIVLTSETGHPGDRWQDLINFDSHYFDKVGE